MTRDEDVLAYECGPLLDERGEWDGPVDLGGSAIAAYFEVEAPLRGVIKEAFVEGAVMVHREL